MVEVPWLTAVATPVLVMVAIWGLLELQVTLLLRSTVPPEPLVPMAINWLVWPGEATDWELGITDMETMLGFAPPPPPPPLVPVTETVAVVVMSPPNPLMLAVIVAEPGATAVATPLESMDATPAELDVHVTTAVTSCVV